MTDTQMSSQVNCLTQLNSTQLSNDVSESELLENERSALESEMTAFQEANESLYTYNQLKLDINE
jgi:hypothetical protein